MVVGRVGRSVARALYVIYDDGSIVVYICIVCLYVCRRGMDVVPIHSIPFHSIPFHRPTDGPIARSNECMNPRSRRCDRWMTTTRWTRTIDRSVASRSMDARARAFVVAPPDRSRHHQSNPSPPFQSMRRGWLFPSPARHTRVFLTRYFSRLDASRWWPIDRCPSIDRYRSLSSITCIDGRR